MAKAKFYSVSPNSSQSTSSSGRWAVRESRTGRFIKRKSMVSTAPHEPLAAGHKRASDSFSVTELQKGVSNWAEEVGVALRSISNEEVERAGTAVFAGWQRTRPDIIISDYVPSEGAPQNIGLLLYSADLVDDVALLMKSEQRLTKFLLPNRRKLFSCRGRIDRVEGERVFATIFRNRELDDPRGIELSTEDFSEDADELTGRWFTYEQYRRTLSRGSSHETVIELLPDERYTQEEADREFERLMSKLPDEF